MTSGVGEYFGTGVAGEYFSPLNQITPPAGEEPEPFVPQAGERFRVVEVKLYGTEDELDRQSVRVGDVLTAGEGWRFWEANQAMAPGHTVVQRDGRTSIARLAPVEMMPHDESGGYCPACGSTPCRNFPGPPNQTLPMAAGSVDAAEREPVVKGSVPNDGTQRSNSTQPAPSAELEDPYAEHRRKLHEKDITPENIAYVTALDNSQRAYERERDWREEGDELDRHAALRSSRDGTLVRCSVAPHETRHPSDWVPPDDFEVFSRSC